MADGGALGRHRRVLGVLDERRVAERTETARLAGPTLIRSADVVTYRLEVFANLEEARAVALSVA